MFLDYYNQDIRPDLCWVTSPKYKGKGRVVKEIVVATFISIFCGTIGYIVGLGF